MEEQHHVQCAANRPHSIFEVLRRAYMLYIYIILYSNKGEARPPKPKPEKLRAETI